jgi:hypothetical protein
MKAMRVTDIHLIKQMHQASEHEYTVAHVETPESHRKYLGFERLVNPGIRVDTLPNSQSDMALAGASRPNDASNIPQRQTISTPSHEDCALLSSSTALLDSLCKQRPHNANNVVRALANPKVEQTEYWGGSSSGQIALSTSTSWQYSQSLCTRVRQATSSSPRMLVKVLQVDYKLQETLVNKIIREYNKRVTSFKEAVGSKACNFDKY